MFTLTDYNEQILEPMLRRQVDILYGQIQMFPPGPPPTRKRRIRWWIEDKKQRAKDIWTILSGSDIHENCGDY